MKKLIERSPRERVPESVDVALHELSVSGLVVRNSRIPARLEDVSQTGMRISSPRRLMTFTAVLCEFTVQDVLVGIPTIAQVRWVEKLNGGSSYSIGLQYLL